MPSLAQAASLERFVTHQILGELDWYVWRTGQGQNN